MVTDETVWEDYYKEFGRYFSKGAVREGCHPRIFRAGEPAKHALVLVHGLTDSPYFMDAIARRFHKEGFTVLVPLLQGHGLNEPRGMKGVSLDAWRENVGFAVKHARQLAGTVSIGGLSTGGCLAVDRCMRNGDINGAVFLFSAALDLAGSRGNFREWFLRTPVSLLLDIADDQFGSSLIGDNPYRYSRMDKGGARQLAHLIKQLEELTAPLSKKKPLAQALFAAHSEADETADIRGVEELVSKAIAARRQFFRIGAGFRVAHASVVLAEDVTSANGSPLEPRNPFFHEMMNAAEDFARQQLKI